MPSLLAAIGGIIERHMIGVGWSAMAGKPNACNWHCRPVPGACDYSKCG
jgi:hypothetical protein